MYFTVYITVRSASGGSESAYSIVFASMRVYGCEFCVITRALKTQEHEYFSIGA